MAFERPSTSIPLVPVSWGELLDKITILEIKVERISDSAAQANVRRELTLLSEVAGAVLADPAIAEDLARLKEVNDTLWAIEDRIRAKDASGQFDAEFVRLARAVYRKNDERADVKRQLNFLLRSELIEEKSYSRPAISFGQRE